jgi:octaprenyl-diphosphate synthase
LALGDFLKSLEPLRASVREVMEEVLSESSELLGEIGLYSFQGGGKLLRPLIYLLSLESLGTPATNAHLRSSTIFELIHLASLLHDDIVDLSSTRRGRKAAHLVFGVPETVLAGDFLVGTAGNLAVKTGSIEFLELLQKSMLELSIGALHELKARWNSDLTAEQYFQIIRCKTSVLFSAAAKGAGILTGASKADIHSLFLFSLNYGLSFQIVDDILDYLADPAELGKPVFQDQMEGRITLPFILAKERLNPSDRSRLCELGAKIDKEPTDLREISDLITSGAGLDRAKEEAKNLLELGLLSLKRLPYSERLSALAKESLERSS